MNWNLNREISKLNYRIHTDAIKDNLIPPDLTSAQIAYTYANEADMLNVVLFGKTAKQWKDENSDLKGYMRDVARLHQLIVHENDYAKAYDFFYEFLCKAHSIIRRICI